jgi:hypothetical protein
MKFVITKKGINPAHRIPSIALFPFIKTIDLKKIAFEETQLSHLHVLANEASYVVLKICREIINGNEFENICKDLLSNNFILQKMNHLMN